MKIKYIPTGNIFDLPEKEAKRIYIESKGYNYEIIDKTDIVPEEKEEKTTVYEEIVETDETAETTKATEDMTKEELMALCDTLGIEYKKTAKKAELINLLTVNEEKAGE